MIGQLTAATAIIDEYLRFGEIKLIVAPSCAFVTRKDKKDKHI